MFESVLYFVLGFLCSALIALMISPAIWNRAVVLTKKRIESSVPLTLNEIQADKDQLRAEFAMSTRRLEISIEELKETAANQVIEINRKRDELAKISAETRQKMADVEELEAQAAELRAKLTDREAALEKTSSKLHDTESSLEESALELEEMRTKMREVQSESDSRRVELVAKQTEIEGIADELKIHSGKEEKLVEDMKQLRKELREAKAVIKGFDDKSEGTDKRLARLQKTNKDLEQKLQKANKELNSLRKNGQDSNDKDSDTKDLLTAERAKVTELEAQLATASLRMEALLEDASNTNVKKAMESLNQDRESFKATINELTEERDALKAELDAQKRVTDADWDTERRENATLRERINDLAAQVTAMTASLEGPGSPINDILARTPPPPKIGKSGSTKDDIQQVESLADRIRALQESARQKEA